MKRSLLSLPLLSLLLACSPDLPTVGSHTSDVDAPTLSFEPPAEDPSLAPTITRLHVSGVPTAAPEAFVLVRGEVGAAQLRQLRSGEVSRALSERLVPTLSWAESEGPTRVVVVSPSTPLEPGADYTLASGEPSVALPFRVAEHDDTPALTRLWPPVEDTRGAGFAVLCGDATLPRLELPILTAPLDLPGTLRTGASPDAGARCLRFEVDAAGPVPLGAVVQLPPLLELAGTSTRFAPEPLVEGAPPQPLEPLACEPDEVRLGPGCARFEDDRAQVRSPGAPRLWAIGGDGVDQVIATAPFEPFVLSPLPPSSALVLSVTTYDPAGRRSSERVGVATTAPAPHLVINEVLADAIGPEPQQEWVELYNDGLTEVRLGGYVLRDVGGEAPLPDVALAPGAYALLVNDTFLEDDGYDAPPAPDTLIVRVGKLGKNGLSNSGEPIDLIDPAGRYASRFMAMKSKEHGQSLARVTPRSPDGWPLSFTLAAPTPGAPNARPRPQPR